MSSLTALRIEKSDKKLAKDVHDRFSKKEGAYAIATRSALEWLAACLRTFRPKRVLEMGAGIGTITELLLLHPHKVEQIISIEKDEYCLNVLRSNLSNCEDPRLKVVSFPEQLAQWNFQADLIIGDGGFYRKSNEEFRTVTEGTIVLAEGHRPELRRLLGNYLQNQGLIVSYEQYGSPLFPYRWRFIPWWRPFQRILPVSIKTQATRWQIPILCRHNKGGCWIGIVRKALSNHRAA